MLLTVSLFCGEVLLSISVTKVCELSNIRDLCERKLISKVSVTNNLHQRKIVRGNQA